MLNLRGQGHFLNTWGDKAQVSESISCSLFPLERKYANTGGEKIIIPLGVESAGYLMDYTCAAVQTLSLTLQMPAQLETLLFRVSLLTPVTSTEQFSLVGDYSLTIYMKLRFGYYVSFRQAHAIISELFFFPCQSVSTFLSDGWFDIYCLLFWPL